MKVKQLLEQYHQLSHTLASASYDDESCRKMRQARKLATQLDASEAGNYEAQLYLTLEQNPSQPLVKMEAACQKKALTGEDVMGLMRPILYSAGVGLAFAFCAALLTSVIGSIAALVAAVACALYPVIKKLVIRHQRQIFLKRAKSMLSLLQITPTNNLQSQQRPGPMQNRPINIFMVSIFCGQQPMSCRRAETAHYPQRSQLRLMDRCVSMTPA